MEKITAVVVDDELASRSFLVEMVKDCCSQIEVIAALSNPLELEKFVQHKQPDILFLDVNMPQKTGFEILDDIGHLDIQVIFVTAFQEFAPMAFRYNAVDFLIKPIRIEQLKEAVDKAIQNKKDALLRQLSKFSNYDLPKTEPKKESAKFAVRAHDKIVILSEEEILYLKANGNYTEFHCVDGKQYMTSKNLKEFESVLSNDIFVRVHHSYLVNTAHSYVFDTVASEVVFSDETRVPVSVRRKKVLMEKYLSGVKK